MVMMTRKRIRGFPIDERMISSMTLSVRFARDLSRFPTVFIMTMPIMPLMRMMRAEIFEGTISYMSSWKGNSSGHLDLSSLLSMGHVV